MMAITFFLGDGPSICDIPSYLDSPHLAKLTLKYFEKKYMLNRKWLNMLCNVSSYVVIQHCLALPNMNKNWLSMYYGEYTMVLYSMVEKCYNGYELVVFSGHRIFQCFLSLFHKVL